MDGADGGGWPRATESLGTGTMYRNPLARLPTRCRLHNLTTVAHRINVPYVAHQGFMPLAIAQSSNPLVT